MRMFDPPHPGEFIRYVYMEPYGLTVRMVAKYLDVAPSTLTRLLNGSSAVTPEMAIRLSRVFGRSPESWMAMQDAYSLVNAKLKTDLQKLKKLELPTN